MYVVVKEGGAEGREDGGGGGERRMLPEGSGPSRYTNPLQQ